MKTASHELPQQSEVKTSETPKLRPIRRLRELWSYREILANLTRKEVKVKYTSSVLGAAWSMLNPILALLVFWLVFGVVLPNTSAPDFPVYLLTGLLAWNLFGGSLTLSARSVVENANLVKKVAFPREILPLASIGASLVDFVLQAIVLAVFMAILQHAFFGVNFALFPLALLALLTFTAALSLWVGALNVRYRDVQHILNLALLMWFWFTPVVYPSGFLMWKAGHHAFLGINLSVVYQVLNPVADIVMGFQRALYANVNCPPVINAQHQCTLYDVSVGHQVLVLAGVVAGSLVLLYLFWRTFFRHSGDFAEEL